MLLTPKLRGDTNIPLYAHLQALQEERDKLAAERDRRYTEVSIEREKALKIKDQADRDALALSRADQTYKDERANNLRTQLERERGDYATKDDLASLAEKLDATVKPLVDFVARSRGGTDKWGQIVIGVGLILGIITVIIKF